MFVILSYIPTRLIGIILLKTYHVNRKIEFDKTVCEKSRRQTDNDHADEGRKGYHMT